MHFLFAIYKYFPFGGLQNDLLRIAEAATVRGHSIDIYTTSWEGPQPGSNGKISIHLVHSAGCSNQGRMSSFAKMMSKILAETKHDVSVAFNRLPGFNWYFAADDCLACRLPQRHSKLVLACHPRYRTLLDMERAVFHSSPRTQIMYISEQQKKDFCEA